MALAKVVKISSRRYIYEAILYNENAYIKLRDEETMKNIQFVNYNSISLKNCLAIIHDLFAAFL